jgi:voltage-gated potassium channel
MVPTRGTERPYRPRQPETPMDALTPRPRWWLIMLGLLRAAVSSAVMVTLYYVLPLGARSTGYVIVELSVGLALFTVMMAWQVSAIARSKHPRIRAIQALATATPLFLLLFAATYFIMSEQIPATFTEPLSRSDALYFTITVFSTVGFGDISAKDEVARLVVAVQMLLDLIILGVGIQVILGAVERGQAAHESNNSKRATSDPRD